MPGRNTQSNLQGGFTSGGTTTINGNTYVSNLTVTTRIGNTPNTYKAATSIEFIGEYANNGNEEYEAFIVNSTNPDPNPTTGAVNSSSDGYRFGFQNQEKTDEISGAGNHTTAMFWEYDTRLGRRWNLDPKPEPSISNYAAFRNNPILFTDLLGDTTYRFNMKGSYLGMVDLDIAGIRGVAGNMSKVKDAGGKMIDQFNPERNFNFNDPSLDRTQLNSMKVGEQGLTFLSDENINAMMNDAGAGGNPSYKTIFLNSKTKGLWDFSSSYLLPALKLDPDKKIPLGDTKGGFLLMGNSSVAYNVNDAGNWLWAQSMSRGGVSLGLAKAAAHGNSILLDRAGWDSQSDQNAIGQGYIYKVQTKDAIYHRIFLANPVKQNANSPKQWGH